MKNFLLGNYAPPSVTLVKGEGAWAWDNQGKKYLDFTSGIAVNALGHGHPAWKKALQTQVEELSHVSNLFAHPFSQPLAEKICQRAGEGKVFYCNSGTEANEALLKLTRLFGKKYKNGGHHVICAEHGFHGRTFGGMSATPQEKIRAGFGPLLEGFSWAPLNDLSRFAELITDQTTAIFIETIQGESGIWPASAAFLQGLRKLCDEHNLLLLLDEVQCGAGRTGTFFAFEEAGIRPDAIGMAKGLGGGFPLGAIWLDVKWQELFQPGSHGTTFGGNPLACRAALAVLETIEKEDLLAQVKKQSAYFIGELQKLVREKPILQEVRGRGYLLGLGMTEAPAPYIAKVREAGLLTVPAGHNTMRLLPPLTVSEDELAQCLQILHKEL